MKQLEWGDLAPRVDHEKLRREAHLKLIVDYLGEDDREHTFSRPEVLELMRRAAELASGAAPKKPRPATKRVPKPTDESPVVETFPTAHGGTWELRKSLFDVLCAAHPKLNGMQVIREAKAYLMTERVYTAQGMPRFLRAQFERAQRNAERGWTRWSDNRPGAVAPTPPVRKSTMEPDYAREIRELQARRAQEKAQPRGKVLTLFDQVAQK